MTATNPNPPPYTYRHWAKADPENRARIHLLEHHLADVGACFEQLLRQPTIRQRLACSGGREQLDETTAARLTVFAAIHDIGKVNAGFQTQIWRPEDWIGGRLPPSFRRVGHIQDLTPVLNGEDADWFFPALGFAEMGQWDDQDGLIVCNLFIAALSHHGRPLNLNNGLNKNTEAWQPYGALNPRECTERIGQLMRQWFPAAFANDAPPLPKSPAFQRHFLGLCILADWIGSNEKLFPFGDQPDSNYIDRARQQAQTAIAAIGLDLAQQRAAFAGVPDFANLFKLDGAPPPNAIQRQAAQDTPLDCPLVIIESETGSGKTEAALWRFARMYQQGLVDGLYFALPTRAAAGQIYGRVQRLVKNLFPAGHCPEVVPALPGYIDRASPPGGLQDYPVWWEWQHGERPWAAERPKRYLAAQIAVGTVDQAMLAALQAPHAHLRAASLARNLLVVDEVHASDPYMREVLAALLQAHRENGGYALLMSATLGSAARQRWLAANPANPAAAGDMPLSAAIAEPYPALSQASPAGYRLDAAGFNDQAKIVAMESLPAMHDFDQVAARALAAARRGAKVLIIRNTVGHARRTQQALETGTGDADRPSRVSGNPAALETWAGDADRHSRAGGNPAALEIRAGDDTELLFAVRGITTLHHSRFAAADRRLLDAAVEEQLGRDRRAGGRIVVGTQTLEQSLDMDADLLISDLCPADVLLQRLGRLHRHRRADRPTGYARPHCIVLTPGEDLSPLLNRRPEQDPNGLGPRGVVYGSLHILEATRRLLDEYGEWRIPAMNRELVERATHPAALDKITQELGAEWAAHANDTEGGHIADRQIARGHILQLDKSFYEDNREVIFPDRDEKIRTRLGDDQVEVTFAPPPASPFAPESSIDRITLPLRWLGGNEIPESATAERVDGGFAFRIGSRQFRYDRLGLRRV